MVVGPPFGHTAANATRASKHTHVHAIRHPVKYFTWDDANNAKLKKEPGIGFEDVVFHIERRDLLDILEHSSPDRYPGQPIFVIRREDYVYKVPFVEDEHTVLHPSHDDDDHPEPEGDQGVPRRKDRR